MTKKQYSTTSNQNFKKQNKASLKKYYTPINLVVPVIIALNQLDIPQSLEIAKYLPKT